MDGVAVRTVENTHWHQPLYLIFDSETMPNWIGMPDDADLPSTFNIEAVRAWKQKRSINKVDELRWVERCRDWVLRCFTVLIRALLWLTRDQVG